MNWIYSDDPSGTESFTAAVVEKSVFYNTFVTIRAMSGGRTHTFTPFVTFNASHLFHFCHTHTAMFLRDGNRLHATLAFMLAAYAVSETAIFTAEATWKDAKCLRNQQFHVAAQTCWWKQRYCVSGKLRERKWGNLFGLHLQTSHILLSLLITL